MKGMVFVELLTMAENVLGEDAVDEIIEAADLPSGGVYTAVGRYDCAELMTLVAAIGAHADAPLDVLQRQFGGWMLDRFQKVYPAFFEGKPDALAMLEAIDGEVHVEVRKLYPDAELPSFETARAGPDKLRLVYRSQRPLAEFCHGLIDGCLNHFGTPGTIARRTLPSDAGVAEEFTVTLTAEKAA